MSVPRNDERRSSPRFELDEQLSGVLKIDSDQSLTVGVLNVSENGLMIETNSSLEQGKEATLFFLSVEFRIAVAWCERVDQGETTFHCGCRVVEGPDPSECLEQSGIDLERI